MDDDYDDDNDDDDEEEAEEEEEEEEKEEEERSKRRGRAWCWWCGRMGSTARIGRCVVYKVWLPDDCRWGRCRGMGGAVRNLQQATNGVVVDANTHPRPWMSKPG